MEIFHRGLTKLSLLALLLCNSTREQEPATSAVPEPKAAQSQQTNAAQTSLAHETPTEPGSASAAASAQVPPSDQPIGLAAMSAASRLSHALLVQSLAAQPQENAVISGYSFAQALQLVREAASGRTRGQIERTLWGVVDEKRELERLPDSRGAGQFLSANAVFVARELSVKPSFKPQAEFRQVDFKAKGTLSQLNLLFSKATEGKIPNMFAQLPPDSQFVLANALYFKGSWLSAFDPEQTKVGPFAGGQQASFMHAKRMLDYVKLDDGEALRLPFNGALNLWLILPLSTPSEWLSRNPDLLTGYLRTRILEVTLSLPRFDIAGGGDVTRFAEPLGLAPLFTQSADFTAMSDEPLKLGQIVHRATLKIDESGAEGSAATALTGVRSVSITQAITIKFDRPFIAVVLDSREEQTLILAAVIQKVQP